ncbi:MAG TPA: ABC transporter permease [Vicinamibacterales bacterium]|jgi:predicted permease
MGERWVSLLLACYPAAFRARFGDGMRDTLARDREQARARGRVALAVFRVQSLSDALRFGLAERRPKGASMRSFFTVDLRDALRSLRASPVLTLVAVVSLALGIGANAALFSILNSLILKTLPVHDPARLVMIDGGSWTNPIWEQIRERRRDLFEDAFAWSAGPVNLAVHGETDAVDGVWASGNMFDVLGVPAFLGRTFTEADDVRGGGAEGAVAVVGYGFWQRRMGGSPDAVGRRLTVDGIDVTVIGIAPRGFLGPDVGRSADVIVPIGARTLVAGQSQVLEARSTWWLEIMGRLKPGQTIDEAAATLDAARPQIRLASLPAAWPAKMQARFLSEAFTLTPSSHGDSSLRRSYTGPLQIVLGLVGAVLIVACANLANLLLARAASRRHELSVRLALGASRFRLAKQLLAETAILAAAGAGIGLLVAQWGSALLVRQIATPSAGVTLDLSIDWRVIAFTTSVAALTALVFGVAPAVGLTRLAPQDAIKEQTRTVSGDRRFGLRSVLVAVQVGLSLALVVGGLLFVRTLTSLSSASLGFNPEGLVSIHVDARRYEGGTREAKTQLLDRLRDTAAAVPGVTSASLSVLTPIDSARWNTSVDATPATAGLTDRQRVPWVNVISPGWFRTYDMHLIAGRDFDARDTAGAERVMVVNESFARRFFGKGPAVGQQIRASLDGSNNRPYRIVGIVNDAVYTTARRGFEPTIYSPIAQLGDVPTTAAVTVRAASGPGGQLARDLSTALTQADPKISFTIRPLSAQLSASIRQERLVAMLAGFFGALALLLAAIGLYGVTAHSVASRRAEIGIRMALGADPAGVIGLVLRRLGWLLAAGIALGIGASWWTVVLFEKLLFGMQPRDPLTFTLAAGTLLAAGLLAGWLPAYRAARIDPVQALREA